MQNDPHLLEAYDFVPYLGKNHSYFFQTSRGVLYEAIFKPSGYIFPEEAPKLREYVFDFSIVIIEKPEGKLPQPDNRIPATVAAIFHHFFITRERVVVYICETADLRASARMRKFNQWFEWYRGKEFIQVSLPIEQDKAGEKYYNAMIFHSSNSLIGILVEAYTKLINSYKK
jgi:hypothetical protein